MGHTLETRGLNRHRTWSSSVAILVQSSSTQSSVGQSPPSPCRRHHPGTQKQPLFIHCFLFSEPVSGCRSHLGRLLQRRFFSVWAQSSSCFADWQCSMRSIPRFGRSCPSSCQETLLFFLVRFKRTGQTLPLRNEFEAAESDRMSSSFQCVGLFSFSVVCYDLLSKLNFSSKPRSKAPNQLRLWLLSSSKKELEPCLQQYLQRSNNQ